MPKLTSKVYDCPTCRTTGKLEVVKVQDNGSKIVECRFCQTKQTMQGRV